MAKGEKVEIEITATDRASDDLREVDRRAAALDGTSADVEIDADTAGFEDALESLKGGIGGIASQLGGMAGPAGAVAALGAGLFVAADGAADAAIAVDNLSRLTGDTVEDTSKMAAIWKTSGGDLTDLADIYLQMSGTLAGNVELAAQLGINMGDGATQGQRFEQVVAALDRIPDATERAVLASQLFGEEGVRQVNDLLGMYPDLERAKADVAEQSVFSDEDVANAREMKANTAELKAEFSNFATTVGTVVVPAIAGLFGALNDVFDLAHRTGQDIGAALMGQQDVLERNRAITEGWEDAEAAARSFDRAQLEGLDTFDQVHAAVLEVTGDVTAANIVSVEWAKTHEDAGVKAVDAYDDTSTAMSDYVSMLETKGSAVQRELQDQAREVEALESAFDDLHAEISDEQSTIRLGQGFDDLKAKAIDAYAKATAGSVEAKEAQEDLRLGQLSQQDAVLDYIETLGNVPLTTTTDILALIDQGLYDEAQRKLDALERTRTTDVEVIPHVPAWAMSSLPPWLRGASNVASVNGTASSPAATTRRGPGPSTLGSPSVAVPFVPVAMPATPAGVGTVNIYLPRTAAGTDVVDAVERWRRVNGRRP